MITYKNYLYQIINNLSPQFISILTLLIFAETSGYANFSKFWILVVSWSLGFSLLVGAIDIIFQNENNVKYFYSVILYKVIFFIILLMGEFIFLQYLGFTLLTIFFFSFAFLFQNIVNSVKVYFRIINKDQFVVYQKVVQASILLVLVMLCEPRQVKVYCMLYFCSWFVVCVASISNVIIIDKDILFSNLYHYVNFNYFKSFLTLGTANVTNQLFANIDFIMLSVILGQNTSGKFKFAVLMTSPLLAIFVAIQTIYLSKVSNTSKNKFNILFNKQLKVPLIGLLFYQIGFLILYLFLKYLDYFPSKTTFELLIMVEILSIGYFFNCLTTFSGYNLLGFKKYNLIRNINILIVPVGFFCSFVLINQYGIIGGSISMALSNIVFFMFMKYTENRNYLCVES